MKLAEQRPRALAGQRCSDLKPSLSCQLAIEHVPAPVRTGTGLLHPDLTEGCHSLSGARETERSLGSCNVLVNRDVPFRSSTWEISVHLPPFRAWLCNVCHFKTKKGVLTFFIFHSYSKICRMLSVLTECECPVRWHGHMHGACPVHKDRHSSPHRYLIQAVRPCSLTAAHIRASTSFSV